jgi:magnesium transporter
MTATILNKADTSHPESSAVTFILAPRQLVTVRYADPAPFQNFRKRIETSGKQYDSPGKVFAGLIDAIVERLAEILEKVGSALDSVSLEVFTPSEGKAPRQDFDKILRRVGRCSDLVSKARESLVSLGRLLLFFNESPKPESHTKTVLNDLTSLSDHASFLSTKVNFLLDATLGLINIEQNGIIKIVSVAAVVFLPPTLVASIYGMNFDVMPELKWALGYPFAVLLMISTAVLPYVFFKRKGWL